MSDPERIIVDALNLLKELKARAEDAEKLRDEALRERDEVWEDKEFQQARAEAAEKRIKELEAVLERIANESMDYQYIARAALEAMP